MKRAKYSARPRLFVVLVGGGTDAAVRQVGSLWPPWRTITPGGHNVL